MGRHACADVRGHTACDQPTVITAAPASRSATLRQRAPKLIRVHHRSAAPPGPYGGMCGSTYRPGMAWASVSRSASVASRASRLREARCGRTVAYRPGSLSEVLTEHYVGPIPKRLVWRLGSCPREPPRRTAGCARQPAQRRGGSRLAIWARRSRRPAGIDRKGGGLMWILTSTWCRCKTQILNSGRA